MGKKTKTSSNNIEKKTTEIQALCASCNEIGDRISALSTEVGKVRQEAANKFAQSGDTHSLNIVNDSMAYILNCLSEGKDIDQQYINNIENITSCSSWVQDGGCVSNLIKLYKEQKAKLEKIDRMQKELEDSLYGSESADESGSNNSKSKGKSKDKRKSNNNKSKDKDKSESDNSKGKGKDKSKSNNSKSKVENKSKSKSKDKSKIKKILKFLTVSKSKFRLREKTLKKLILRFKSKKSKKKKTK